MMEFRRKSGGLLRRVKEVPTLALILWACLWINLDTGFWNFEHPNDLGDWLLWIRAALPFIVLPVALFMLFRSRKFRLPKSAPSRLLLIYGVVSTVAAVFSPTPWWALYWSTAFLATILVAWAAIDRRDPVGSARWLLLATWIATFVVAALIARHASNAIFGNIASGYGASFGETEGLSRSSGVARWAAVPGLVCLIRAYHSRQKKFFGIYIGLAAIAFFIVYRMQSRGAVFGSVAALLFALLISSRMRRYALPFALAAIAAILLFDSPATISTKVTEYLERGQSREEFLSMTGRTRAYNKGVVAFADAPFFGYGQWADREIIHEHVHNSYLSALLSSGLVGGVPYLISWITGWFLFFRVQRRIANLTPEDRMHLLEAGTVMMFFTVRAIPETTTAEFGVDLLVMVAVYVYLEVLSRALKSQRRSVPFVGKSRELFELAASR